MNPYYGIVHKNNRHLPCLVESESKNNIIEWFNSRSDLDNYEVYRSTNDSYQSARNFLKFSSEDSVDEIVESEFVPKFFTMNPETDDLVFGKDLKNGMKILAEDTTHRYEVKDELLDWERDRLLVCNRWATVSNLIHHGSTGLFIATYDDGTKRKRNTGASHAWYVKRDSVPQDIVKEEKTAGKFAEVFSILEVVMNDVENRVSNTTQKIVDVFEGE